MWERMNVCPSFHVGTLIGLLQAGFAKEKAIARTYSRDVSIPANVRTCPSRLEYVIDLTSFF